MSHDEIDGLIDQALEAEPLEFEIDEFDPPAGPPLTDGEIQQDEERIVEDPLPAGRQ